MTAMRCDIIFETGLFNVSERKPYFINECCYGDDCGEWLKSRLAEAGMKVTGPSQEDWGWYLEVVHDGGAYFLGVGGNSNQAADKNEGEWRIMVEKHRSVWDRIAGRNKMREDEPILRVLEALLRSEPDVKNVHRE